MNLIRNENEQDKGYPEGKVWYVSKKQNKNVYYVKEVDEKNGAVKWTLHRESALRFHTEGGVHHFIHAHMQDRKDIYLIHAAEI